MRGRVLEAKSVIEPFSAALYDFDPVESPAQIAGVFCAGAIVRVFDPFGDLDGGEALWADAYRGLADAWPDIERRPYIRISGRDAEGATWIGEAGFYTGTFARDWIGIPKTGRTAHMRFHEFFRIDGDRVAEAQFGWDIPEVMLQAGAWPMVPALG
ncbi:MAG: polyketide cyclase, partial [Pseudomonadota bacterium]